MAGAGFKTFNTGDVLTAADVNTYLMQQTVMVFASSAARSTALGVNVAEGMVSYLKDTDVVEVYNGSAWVASDDPNAIQNSIVDAKGDLISATADNTPARLASSGVNGNVLTVDTSTSTGLKWAAPSSPSFVGVSLNSAGQTISSGTDTVRNFNSEFFDTDGYHDNSTNNSRITIPSGKGGKYLIIAASVWAPNSTSFRRLRVRKNGSTLLASYDISAGNGGSGDTYYLSTIKDLVATDYIEVTLRQDTGGNLTSEGGEGYTYFAAYYLGA